MKVSHTVLSILGPGVQEEAVLMAFEARREVV